MPTNHLVKAIPRLLLALWLAIGPAWAGSLPLLGVGTAGAAAPSFSLTFGQIANSAANTAIVPYGTMTWGPGCTRVLLVIATFASSPTISSISVGSGATGGTAVVTATAGSSNLPASIWETTGAVVGSSGSVSVTYSTAPLNDSAVAVYCLITTTPAVSATNTAGTSNGTTAALPATTVPTGGGGLVIGNVFQGGGAATPSLTNATVDGTPFVGVGVALIAGHTTSTGSVSASVNSNVNSVIDAAIATWGP